MAWLLIIFIIAVVVSPLMWFKQSPYQKRLAELRSGAAAVNIRVSLHRRPDARESETALETVCYKMRWEGSDGQRNWVIHRFSGRGWESPWTGWQWVQSEADLSWHEILLEILPELPLNVTAIIATEADVGAIWSERGDHHDLLKIAESLGKLKRHIENISH
jgi:hypothetical protein